MRAWPSSKCHRTFGGTFIYAWKGVSLNGASGCSSLKEKIWGVGVLDCFVWREGQLELPKNCWSWVLSTLIEICVAYCESRLQYKSWKSCQSYNCLVAILDWQKVLEIYTCAWSPWGKPYLPRKIPPFTLRIWPTLTWTARHMELHRHIWIPCRLAVEASSIPNLLPQLQVLEINVTANLHSGLKSPCPWSDLPCEWISH